MIKPYKMLLAQMIGILLVFFLLFSCTKEEVPQDNVYNARGIAAVANNNFSLSYFSAALQVTGYVPLLTEPGPFTVFAPSNDAFNEIGLGSVVEIRNEASRLRQTISYHIYKGKLALNELPYAFNQEVQMANNIKVYISHAKNSRDTAIYINGIRVEPTAFDTANGSIYPIDQLLQPTIPFSLKELIGNDATLTFFNAALQRSGLTGALSNTQEFTVFAPVNAAFNDMGILTIDDIYQMTPAEALKLINPHITKGRRYIYDYIMQANVSTNSFTETMQDGKTASMYLLADNTRPNRFTGIRVEKANASGSATSATLLSDNLTARNGVLHTINTVLK